VTELIRVLIVDDHPLVREGLEAVIALEPDIEVVGEAADGPEAVLLARRLDPDVILMDLLMPGMSGGEAIAAILAETPTQRIIVLTSIDDPQAILEAIRAGAQGYVSKNALPQELLDAIGMVYRGSVVLPPAIAQALLERALPPEPSPLALDALTEREVEVLALVAQGFDNETIGERLVISPRTASVHVSHVLAKLGVDNRTQAALYALRCGLVEL
jgi:NarL family two-component system response regulator LiaR